MKSKITKWAISLMILSCFSYLAFSQTQVSGSIYEDVTWTVDGSPYIITANTTIKANAKLTIEPGVIVKSNKDVELRINGEINATGTPENKILFTSNTPDTWAGLWLDQTKANYDKSLNYIDGSILNYCIVENAYYGLVVTNAHAVIKNSEFRNNDYSGVAIEFAWGALIDSCQISDNIQEGIHILLTDSVVITNSNIRNNKNGIYVRDGKYFSLYNNTLTDNENAGIVSGYSNSGIIRNNLLENNKIGIHIDGKTVNTEFYENIITGNSEKGIRIKEYRLINSEIHNNIINENPVGIDIYHYEEWYAYDSLDQTGNFHIYENQIYNSSDAAIIDVINYTKDFEIRNNTFTNNNSIFKVAKEPTGVYADNTLKLTNNNFFAETASGYYVENLTPKNMDFANNYWGVTDNLEFAEKTYDINDNAEVGEVNYLPVLDHPLSLNPISVPQNVTKEATGEGVKVTWSPNKEGDLAGYKLYYGTSGASYENYIDVGLDTSYVLPDADISDIIIVTAYDQDATGFNDQFEGHESWNSFPIKESFTVELISADAICPSDSLSISVSENYNFTEDNEFIMQLSDLNSSFSNPINLDTINSSLEILTAVLPDTLQNNNVYKLRVLSTELQLFTHPFEITYKGYPSSEFLLATESCQGDTIAIVYNSTLSNDLELQWELNNATVVENKKDSLLLLYWSTNGEKNITLTASRNVCSASSQQTIHVKKTPTADFTVASLLCEGDTAIVNYQGNGADTASYAWNFDGGNVLSGSGNSDHKIIWDTLGKKTISLQVMEDGCASKVETHQTELNSYPVLSFEATSNVCFNENYSIVYTGDSPGEMSWNFGGMSLASGSEAGPYEVKWLTSGMKAITFSIDNKSCKSDTMIQVLVAPETITPNICMVTVDEETSKNKIIWNNNQETIVQFGIYKETNIVNEYALVEYVDAASNMSYIDNQSEPSQVANRYKITAVDTCGVETEMSRLHKTIHLTINKGLGNSWNLIWDGYEGISFDTYRIYRSNGNDSLELLTEVASNLTSYTDLNPPTDSVSYQIEVLNPNGCSGASNGRTNQISASRSNIAKRTQVVTGIGEEIKSPSIEIYPNPTSSSFFIGFEHQITGSYRVTTMSGKQIESGKLQQETEINLKEQPSGMYFLIIYTDKGLQTRKIIKQ